MTRTYPAASTPGSIFTLIDLFGVLLLPPHSLEEVDSAEFLFTGIGNSYCCGAFTISVFPRMPLLGMNDRTAMTILRDSEGAYKGARLHLKAKEADKLIPAEFLSRALVTPSAVF